MKQLFKKIPIVLVLILVSFLYFSCTQEKEYVNEKNRKDVIFKEKTFDEVLKMTMFNEAYQKLTKKKGFITNSSMARTALEDQFGFTIDPELVKIIETNYGKISYNMLITRDVATTDYFENLIIEVDSLNNADAFIAKYHPTEPMKSVPLHDSFTFVGDEEIEQILSSGKMYYIGHDYYLVSTLWCYWLVDNSNHPEWAFPHVATYECTDRDKLEMDTTIICEEQGGGGDNPNPPDSSGSTFNSSTGQNETINQVIVPLVELGVLKQIIY